MGLLLNTDNGQVVALAAHALIGRAPGCPIWIAARCASAEHATLAWAGARWELRDLGSSNGTWVDGRRVAAGARVAVRRGARLGFGTREAGWLMIDDAPAGPSARNGRTGELVHGLDGLALPDATAPQATIHGDADGRWWLTQDDAVRAITDGEQLVLGHETWTVLLPPELGRVTTTVGTADRAITLADVELVLAPSRDEEHVEARLRVDGRPALVLPARSSHYLLLILARLRRQDAVAQIAAEEQGWVRADELADMLRYTAERLNVEIFRARSLFAKMGIDNSMSLIERRTLTRQLRIGISRIAIE